MRHLLEGDKSTAALFATRIEGKPLVIRAELYEYFFPSVAEHWASGMWYKRTRIAAVAPFDMRRS